MSSARSVSLWLSLLGIFGLGAISGCGSEDAEPPTASINGGEARTQKPTRDNLHPVVQIRTSAGEILLQLDAEHAPVTVNNFLNYANRGHYDGTVFHEVESGFIVLGGGYDAKLEEKLTDFPIRNEAHNGLSNTARHRGHGHASRM